MLTGHELDKVAKDFAKDNGEVLVVLFLQFLLKVVASMLIVAERVDLSDKALQSSTGKSVSLNVHNGSLLVGLVGKSNAVRGLLLLLLRLLLLLLHAKQVVRSCSGVAEASGGSR